MGQEAINLTTVVSGFDSGTNLDPVGVRQNNQGVTLAEANGFVSVDAAAPDSATGLKGDFSFNDADNKIYVCVSPFGSIYPGRVIPANCVNRCNSRNLYWYCSNRWFRYRVGRNYRNGRCNNSNQHYINNRGFWIQEH